MLTPLEQAVQAVFSSEGVLLQGTEQFIPRQAQTDMALAVAQAIVAGQEGGHVLVARPAPDHLWAIREGLFGEVQAHQPEKFLPELQAAFSLLEQAEIRFPLPLTQSALKQLLAMTPYVWKAKPERRAALEANPAFATEAAFSLMVFRKA